MKFDKRIERIYMYQRASNIGNFLNEEIIKFPKEHRFLIAARATFIKQKLIFKKRIKGAIHLKYPCGLCVRNGYLDPKCLDCPGHKPCEGRFNMSAQDLMMIAYDIYMNEHKKFVKS